MNFKIIFPVSLFFLTAVAMAQSYNQFMYSPVGYGYEINNSSSFNNSIGIEGLNQIGDNIISPANPAITSFYSLALFDLGILNMHSFSKNNNVNTYNFDALVNHFGFGAPIVNKKIGFGLGLQPLTRSGYNFIDTVDDPLYGKIRFKNTGQGGFTQAYFNLGFNKTIDSIHTFALGAGFRYVFGNVFKIQSKEFLEIPNVYNSRFIQSVSPYDYYFNYGLNYINHKFMKGKLKLAITWQPSTQIKSEYDQLLYTYKGTESTESIKDTVLYLNQTNFPVTFARSYGAGITWENDHLAIFGEYKTEKWNGVKTVFNETMADHHRLTAGLSWLPDANSIKRIKTFRYSGAFKYFNGFYTLYQKPFESYSLNLGLSIPVRMSKNQANFTKNYINVALEIGKRGFRDAGYPGEFFVNFYLGINIADKWFIKRKYY